MSNTPESKDKELPVDEMDNLVEFLENPYNPENIKPADLVRIFYSNNLSIIPVASKRGILIGILFKEDVVSEMSDIARSSNQKIDHFITRLVRKPGFEELFPYVTREKDFIVINIFGEEQGRWSRIELLAACDNVKIENIASTNAEVKNEQEEQVLDWMIYLILEHLPRPLYAINESGKTVFYNGLFDDLYMMRTGNEVDIQVMEKSLGDTSDNEYYYRESAQHNMYFHNKTLDFYYEKIPMISEGRNVGYLIYCANDLNSRGGITFPGVNPDKLSLSEFVDLAEKRILQGALVESLGDLGVMAENLKITAAGLGKRLEKHGLKAELVKKEKKVR